MHRFRLEAVEVLPRDDAERDGREQNEDGAEEEDRGSAHAET